LPLHPTVVLVDLSLRAAGGPKCCSFPQPLSYQKTCLCGRGKSAFHGFPRGAGPPYPGPRAGPGLGRIRARPKKKAGPKAVAFPRKPERSPGTLGWHPGWIEFPDVLPSARRPSLAIKPALPPRGKESPGGLGRTGPVAHGYWKRIEVHRGPRAKGGAGSEWPRFQTAIKGWVFGQPPEAPGVRAGPGGSGRVPSKNQPAPPRAWPTHPSGEAWAGHGALNSKETAASSRALPGGPRGRAFQETTIRLASPAGSGPGGGSNRGVNRRGPRGEPARASAQPAGSGLPGPGRAPGTYALLEAREPTGSGRATGSGGQLTPPPRKLVMDRGPSNLAPFYRAKFRSDP